MTPDAIRIYVTDYGKRTYTLINSEIEDKLANAPDELEPGEELVYKMIYRKAVQLWDAQALTVGDYPLASFEAVPIAAPIVNWGSSTPIRRSLDCFAYIGTPVEV